MASIKSFKGIFLLLLSSSSIIKAQFNTFNTTANGTFPVYSSDTVPLITENSTDNEPNYTAPYFPLLGFQEYEGNPIMALNPANDWESAYLYNPSAIVVDDTIWILNRAQNSSRTSSIGLGWSKDGYNFTRYNNAVIKATEPYEHVGGCEDRESSA